jgi:hypothetical protein
MNIMKFSLIKWDDVDNPLECFSDCDVVFKQGM